MLYVRCTHLLLARTSKTAQTWIFLIYVSVLFTLGTINFASLSQLIRLTLIDNGNYGGSATAAFEAMGSTVPVRVIVTITFIPSNWLADGLTVRYAFY